MLLLCLIPPILVSMLLITFKKRITTAAGLIPLSVASAFSLYIATKTNMFMIAIPIVCIIVWLFVKIKFNSYDFSKRILSLSLDKNKSNNDGRILGKCLPYYKKQLKYNNSTIELSDTAMRGGTIITGSSGSGKTYGIKEMIKQDLSHNKSVVFFDFKGDLSTISDIEESAEEYGAKVYKLTWDECNFVYDPLSNLDDGGRVEAILNMRKWSLDGADDHYKTGTQLFLQKAIREYQHEGGNYLNGFYDFLRTYNVERESFDSYNTVIKLLELTMSSNVGHMFSDGNNKFDFSKDEKFVLLVAFTSSTKALGTSITSLMLRDLMEVGVKRPYNPTLCLYIDEFGSCESPLIVKDILEKGRSCGIATTLSMQDLNQLIISTNAPFMDSVLGTVNTFIVYSGATRQTAEKLAGTQIYEIDDLIMSLMKPVEGKPPTAIIISKYPIFMKGGTEVYRFTPGTFSDKNSNTSSIIEAVQANKQQQSVATTTSEKTNPFHLNNRQDNDYVVEPVVSEFTEEDEKESEEPINIKINYDYFL